MATSFYIKQINGVRVMLPKEAKPKPKKNIRKSVKNITGLSLIILGVIMLSMQISSPATTVNAQSAGDIGSGVSDEPCTPPFCRGEPTDYGEGAEPTPEVLGDSEELELSETQTDLVLPRTGGNEAVSSFITILLAFFMIAGLVISFFSNPKNER